MSRFVKVRKERNRSSLSLVIFPVIFPLSSLASRRPSKNYPSLAVDEFSAGSRRGRASARERDSDMDAALASGLAVDESSQRVACRAGPGPHGSRRRGQGSPALCLGRGLGLTPKPRPTPSTDARSTRSPPPSRAPWSPRARLGGPGAAPAWCPSRPPTPRSSLRADPGRPGLTQGRHRAGTGPTQGGVGRQGRPRPPKGLAQEWWDASDSMPAQGTHCPPWHHEGCIRPIPASYLNPKQRGGMHPAFSSFSPPLLGEIDM